MPVSRSIRRSDQANPANAMTCCFLSSLKTLLTRTEDNFQLEFLAMPAYKAGSPASAKDKQFNVLPTTLIDATASQPFDREISVIHT